MSRWGKKGGRSPLKHPSFGEAQNLVAGDDQVIEDANVYEQQGLPQPAGDELVGLGGFGDAAGVRMHEDHGTGIPLKRLLYDFARMNRSSGQGPAEEFDELNQAMAAVEEEDAE